MKYVINLGDSITISKYPDLYASERFNKEYSGLGAGDLFYKNNDELFPEFKGLDLESLHPGIKHLNLAQDGGIVPDVYRQVKKAIRETDVRDSGVITLTIGGNDLLQLYGTSKNLEEMSRGLDKLRREYSILVAGIVRDFPCAKVILNAVYDPTDGTGYLPGYKHRLPIELLKEFNAEVEFVARRYDCTFVDTEELFMGYGITKMASGKKLNETSLDPSKGGYYWHHSIIEPNIYGANAVRAEWLETVI